MAEGKTSMFGKTYNTIGSTDSNFIIKTKGDLKVQWGNKYIDVIKNGKIASEGSKLLFKVDTEEEIKDNGLYLVGEKEIWLNIDGTKVNITNESGGSAYISYMTDLKLKTEEHHKALTNIGFYYPSLEDAKYANITSGLIYAEKEHKLYIAQNGQLIEYNIVTNNAVEENTSSTDEQPLYINGFYIRTDKTAYIECNSEAISLLTTVFVHDILQSKDADHTRGYRLYIDTQGLSVLEIDYIKQRKYPTPVTYDELRGYVDKKLLSPKMYYMITDFLNPWEVTWDEEAKFYDDKYVEINEEDHLAGVRNVMNLIVQAKSEEALEEQAWYSMHPDWIIKYDVYYNGPEHIITEDNIQYGFRHKTKENGDILYLPCKGQITYLKDEFGNEANFNFRHFLFFRNNVWRYCMDLQMDDSAFFGLFKESKNNQFNIESLDARVQVFKFEEIVENDNIIGYRPYAEDSDVIISIGHNLVILMPKLFKVEENVFNLPKLEENIEHYIRGPELLEFSKNTVINQKLLINILYTSINNYFEDIEKTINITNIPCKDNVFKKFLCDLYITGLFFDGNYLEDFVYNINNLHTFKNNTIHKCLGYINNNNIFEENTFDEIVNDINNLGIFLKNIINKVQYIDNSDECKNNIIVEIERLTNNKIFNDNNITLTKIINNYDTMIGNIINNNIEIHNNSGLFNNNIIEESIIIRNNGELTDNIIKLFLLDFENSGLFKYNSINIVHPYINNSIIFNENDINEIVVISVSATFEKNKINIINSLTTSEPVINNTFLDITNSYIYATVLNNIFSDLESVTINGAVNDNTFVNIYNTTFNGTTEKNVVSGDLKNSSFQSLISNNIFKNFETVIFNDVVEKCIFNLDTLNLTAHSLYVCIFDYIDTLLLDLPVYYTTFHGFIGNITRQLTESDWMLLSDPNKKTDAYPNIRIICVPDSVFLKGMIIMWYGKEEIPEGWALCDGSNGTPDLRNRFIKAIDGDGNGNPTESVGEVDNEDVKWNDQNESVLELKTKNLPKHRHPHTHDMSNLSGTANESGSLSMSLNWTDYNYGLSSNTTSVVSSVSGEGVDSSTASVVSSVSASTQGGTTSGGSHTHSVTINGGNILENTENQDSWLYDDPPTPIKLEPKHYKLIFIMKIERNLY